MPGKYTPEQRIAKFWSRVTITDLLACWEWQGCKDRDGYGQLDVPNKSHTQAHRFAWETVHGPIPKGKLCLHHCDNPGCVNPNHLYIGTDANNMRDRGARGHTLKGENHPQAKLSNHKVREIKKLLSKGVTQASIAQTFGVCHTTISRIATKKHWAHIK